jgi:hypothetical protein
MKSYRSYAAARAALASLNPPGWPANLSWRPSAEALRRLGLYWRPVEGWADGTVMSSEILAVVRGREMVIWQCYGEPE